MMTADVTVDELVKACVRARAQGRTAEALDLVRKAIRLAPLRRDLKGLLADVLQDTPAAEPLTIPVALPPRTHPARRALDGPYARIPLVSGTALRDEDDEDEFDFEDHDGSAFVQQRESRFGRHVVRAAGLAAAGLNGAVNSVARWSESTLRAGPVGESATAVPAPARYPRKSRSRNEDDDASPSFAPGAALAWAMEAFGARVPNPRPIIWSVAYLGMAAFLLTASAFSYSRFQSGSTSESALAAERSDSAPLSATADSGAVSRTEREILRLGRYYVSQARLDDAILLFGGALKERTVPNVEGDVRKELAQAYQAKATRLLEENRLDDAVTFYRRAVEAQPDSAQLHLLLGNAHYFCGTYSQGRAARAHYEKALQSLNRSIELDRDNVLAYQRVATVYEGLERTTQARDAWDQVIRTSPQSPEAEEAHQRLKALSIARR